MKRMRLGRSAVETVTTGFLIQGMLVVSGILAARLLGPEGRGYLALLALYPAVVAQLGALGLPQSVTHFVARDPAIAPRMMDRVLRTVRIQCLLLVLVHALVLVVYLHDKPSEVVFAGLATVAVVPGILTQQYGLAVLQSLGRFRSFNVLRVAGPAAYSAGMAGLLLADRQSLPLVAAIWSLVQLLIGFLAIGKATRSARAHDPEDGGGQALPALREMLSYGVRGMLGYSSPLENFRFDQLVAGLYLSPAALGLYVVAQAFTNLPRFVAQSLGMVAFPVLSAMESPARARTQIALFTGSVVVFNGLLAVPLYLFMPWLVETFFGVAFTDSVPVARILLVGALLWSVRRILVECLRGVGYPEVSTFAELSMYPALLLSLLLLVPGLGLQGLSLSIVIGQFASLLVAAMLSVRVLREAA